ncbi:MAG: signal peptidase I [Acidimicrobiia bacterium]|nr:signal peptidase I [Acidimicrobiia bacterium]
MSELPGDSLLPPDDDAPGDDVLMEDPPADEDEPRHSEALAFLKELPFLIVGALVVAVLVKSFLIQVFWIPSGSMEDTLEIGDRVIVNKVSYRFGDPGRGDIVVFEPETFEEESIPTKISRNLLESIGLRTPESDLIKRVIGLPGETVEIRNNTVFVDGSPLDEPYLPIGLSMRDEGPWEVPDDHYFVMGDNRNSSNDSRRFGAIDRDRIVGRAFSVVWPPSRWGGL